jgi:hypothetical protein
LGITVTYLVYDSTQGNTGAAIMDAQAGFGNLLGIIDTIDKTKSVFTDISIWTSAVSTAYLIGECLG